MEDWKSPNFEKPTVNTEVEVLVSGVAHLATMLSNGNWSNGFVVSKWRYKKDLISEILVNLNKLENKKSTNDR